MKKIIGAALAGILLAGALTGCGMQEGKKLPPKSMKIGISVYDQYDTFVASEIAYLEELAKEKQKGEDYTISLEIASAGGSQLAQNDQVEAFIDNGCDVVCVNLVDRTDTSVIIDKAKNADIPVVFFNRELVEEDLDRWDKLYYVGAVALESGAMQGEIVAKAWEENQEAMDKNGDGKLQYVILEGEPGHQDALVRTEYVVNTITEAGITVEKLGNGIANWNRAQARTKMDQWISEFGSEIEVVLSNNDDMALGALDALTETPLDPAPLVVGIDGTDVALEAVIRGELYGTVYNNAKGQAEGILELACSLVFGTEIPEEITLLDGKYIRLPYEKVTRENAPEYLYNQKK